MFTLRTGWRLAGVMAALATSGLISAGSAAQTTNDHNAPPPNAVLTFHNDIGRTGLFNAETVLTPSNVYMQNFGKLYSLSVDGFIYAQPLFVPGVIIPGKGTFDIVYVATEHDSVYAFNANSSSGPLWKTSFTTAAGVTSVPSADVGTGDLVPEIGISATPVINYLSNTIYVEAKTKEVVNGVTNYVHRLHALDIRTGLEKPNSPVVIQGTSVGTGDGNDGNGHVPWNPLRQHVRPALLLNNGVVYVASASHGDIGPYHGWVFGYEQVSLKQLYSINLTPNGGLGGIWQAGSGMAADYTGDMYLATGNGTFTADPSFGNGIDYGDSYVRLSIGTGSLKVKDFFTPLDQAFLDAVDSDLGSGGVMIPPVQTGKYPNILIGCGKEGTIFVVNRDGMSHFHSGGNQIIQTLTNAIGGTWSSPAYFNNHIYYCGVGDRLKSYSLSGGLLSTTPVSQSKLAVGYPSSTPSISANGTKNGIVWLIQSDAYGSNGNAILHAFDATNLTTELYNSAQAPNNRDAAGPAVKFSVPTITSGKVFVGTQNQLTVYGIL
jgi:hypothetical protein